MPTIQNASLWNFGPEMVSQLQPVIVKELLVWSDSWIKIGSWAHNSPYSRVMKLKLNAAVCTNECLPETQYILPKFYYSEWKPLALDSIFRYNHSCREFQNWYSSLSQSVITQIHNPTSIIQEKKSNNLILDNLIFT